MDVDLQASRASAAAPVSSTVNHTVTRVRPKFEDILEGIEFVSSGYLTEHAAYLCKETGRIFWRSEDLDEPLPEDFDDPEKYLTLPHKRDLELGKPLSKSDQHVPV